MDTFQEDFNSAILQACEIHGVDYLKDIQAKETFTPAHIPTCTLALVQVSYRFTYSPCERAVR